MSQQITIPLKALEACAVIAPKKEVRFFLCGVAVNQSHLVATDGHRLFAYKLNDVSEETKIIIPQLAVTSFLKKVKNDKHLEESECVLKIEDASCELYLNDNIFEVFRPLVGNFPDWQKVVPKNAQKQYNGILPVFNSKFLFDFEVVHGILNNRKRIAGSHIFASGENGAAKFIFNDDNAIGVIMPIKSDYYNTDEPKEKQKQNDEQNALEISLSFFIHLEILVRSLLKNSNNIEKDIENAMQEFLNAQPAQHKTQKSLEFFEQSKQSLLLNVQDIQEKVTANKSIIS